MYVHIFDTADDKTRILYLSNRTQLRYVLFTLISAVWSSKSLLTQYNIYIIIYIHYVSFTIREYADTPSAVARA